MRIEKESKTPRRTKTVTGKESDFGAKASSNAGDPKQESNITSEYPVGGPPDDNVHLLHPNRNPDKRRNKSKKPKENPIDKSIRIKASQDVDAPQPEELPGIITKQLFAELANYRGELCVSLYMPTHKSGVELNGLQDQVVFRNAVQKIEAQLKELNTDELLIERVLKPAYALALNEKFWRSLNMGLAFFITEGYFKYIKLPITPPEEILVNKSFYLRPLIQVITQEEHFYLLVLSKKQALFYRADAFGMEKLEIEGMPKGIDDVVHFEEKDDQKLFRTGDSGNANKGNFHGIGAGKPDEKTNIALYLEELDDTLWKASLHRETAPLLLAGIEYIIPIYRAVSDYNHIWSDAIVRGGLEHETDATLYRWALEKMKPYFGQKRERALDTYFNQSATALTSSLPTVIIPAAYYGRISHLFVQKDAHIWGKFDEQNNQLFLHNVQTGGEDCLADKAAIQTLLKGGEVYVLDKEQMPGDDLMAAVLRY